MNANALFIVKVNLAIFFLVLPSTQHIKQVNMFYLSSGSKVKGWELHMEIYKIPLFYQRANSLVGEHEV